MPVLPEALPAGSYHVRIVESEIKRNKTNTGDLLVSRLKVLDGPQKGRFLFVNLSISNEAKPEKSTQES